MSFSIEALDSIRSVEGLASYRTEVTDRMTELDVEAKGLPFGTEAAAEFADLIGVRDEIDKRTKELNFRTAQLSTAATFESRIEAATSPVSRGRTSRVPDDIHNIAEYRQFARDIDDLPGLYLEGSKRFLGSIDQDTAHLLDATMKKVSDAKAPLALRYLECGSQAYSDAFGKMVMRQPMTPREMAALGTYTNSGADGGYAVPVFLDPTLIPTADIEINEIRSIARVETITGKEWNGVTSGGISVSRVAETVAITPTSPTLGQPRVVPTAVKAEIRFSVEVDGDWPQLQAEMARELAEAKVNEEATTFTTGTGDGATGPQGIERMADTSIVWSQASGAVGVEDIFALETDRSGGNSLPARFRKGASFLANKSIYNYFRTLSVGTVGEGAVWARGLQPGLPPELIGYPAYENSVMDETLTNGNDILILGQFKYFLIVDRVGMSVELNPHVVDGSGNSLGQRAIIAYWRNGSKILSSNAFRKLRVGEGS